jgi:hypothetical protein
MTLRLLARRATSSRLTLAAAALTVGSMTRSGETEILEGELEPETVERAAVSEPAPARALRADSPVETGVRHPSPLSWIVALRGYREAALLAPGPPYEAAPDRT